MNKAISIGFVIILMISAMGCLDAPAPGGTIVNPTPTPQPTYTYPTYEELKWVLDNYEHTHEYERDVFDCVEMSIATAYLLQEDYSWDTLVAVGMIDEETRVGHAWVLVKMNINQWVAVEATAGGIGVMTDDLEYYSGEEVFWRGEWYEVYEVTK